MKKETYDCLVLGLGGMGSATLYALAQRGVRACGVEQLGVAHDRGSSHGDTRIIRKAYFEHPDYLPLLNRAYDLWEELQRAAGKQLFVRCPMMVAGAPAAEVIKGLEICYENHDLPHERLSAAAAHQRYPQFHLPEDFIVYLDPVAGFLYPETCIAAQIGRAQKWGATVYNNEKVESWEENKNGFRVKTERREIAAEKLIITAGAWANRELASLKLPLQIWRRVMFWYDCGNLADFERERFPIFYVETQRGGFYGFPAIDEWGLKVAEHTTPQVISDPDLVNRTLAAGDEPPVLDFLREFLPGLAPRRSKFSVCMYTMTPDGHFIIDRHPLRPNLVFAAGFSGHGFKFAPVVGEILSDLALHGHTAHPVEFLRLGRFFNS